MYINVSDAYENARFLCDQYYMACPEVEFIVINRKSTALVDSLDELFYAIHASLIVTEQHFICIKYEYELIQNNFQTVTFIKAKFSLLFVMFILLIFFQPMKNQKSVQCVMCHLISTICYLN